MTQEFAITKNDVTYSDSSFIDSFGRLRVSNPTGLFDSQFTYDLQPLLYEQVIAESGATITHDTTNRGAIMTFSSTPTGGKAFMEQFAYNQYQPGKSQKISISFNFVEQTANCLKFAEYGDGTNGIAFQNDGSNNKFTIYSATDNGDQSVNQSAWNLDKLDGTGLSGITLDITQKQILVIDVQALYTGRVRIGFDLDGITVYCHEFKHSNTIVNPYIQTANLPIRVGMTCTGTVSTTMTFTCCSVVSEGGTDKTIGFEFAQEGTATAASGVRTHLLSIRPKTTFNSITNRASLFFIEIDLLVTGTSPVKWELVIGQALTTPSWADVNTTYSSTEYDVAGTLSGNPAIVIDGSYIEPSGSGSKAGGQSGMNLTLRYPITLDAAGAVRALGTMSLLATGIDGSSACRATIKWTEVR